MRIVNPNTNTHFYVGKCKNNEAPKHVQAEGTKKVVKLDGKLNVALFDSPGSKKYIYAKVTVNKEVQWLWIEDKSIFQLDELSSTKVTRIPKPVVDMTESEGLKPF